MYIVSGTPPSVVLLFSVPLKINRIKCFVLTEQRVLNLCMLKSTLKSTRRPIKSWKNVGEKLFIFALDPKLEMDTKTLVLQSGHKFMCFVEQFHEKFGFWY